MRLRARGLAALLLLCACTKHDEREITPYLKVDIKRPITGTSGVIVAGSRGTMKR